MRQCRSASCFRGKGDLSCEAPSAKQDGGEDGIRTHEKLLTSTPLAGERLRPLGHLSVAPVDKEKRRHNQQAGAIIIEKTGFRQMALSPCGDSAAIPRPATHDSGAIPAGNCRNWPDCEGLAQGFPIAQWLTGAFRVRPNRVICATTQGDSTRTDLLPIRWWLNAAASWVMSNSKERRGAHLFR